MPCQTCAHTMQSFSSGAFWCPRCGTVKTLPDEVVSVPKLVERCRNLQSTLIEAQQPEGIEAIRMLGIIESINTPGNRPSE